MELLRARRRARRSTSAVPAAVPATSAAAGRAQLRGSRIAESSHASSSSAAISVIEVRVLSSAHDQILGRLDRRERFAQEPLEVG